MTRIPYRRPEDMTEQGWREILQNRKGACGQKEKDETHPDGGGLEKSERAIATLRVPGPVRRRTLWVGEQPVAPERQHQKHGQCQAAGAKAGSVPAGDCRHGSHESRTSRPTSAISAAGIPMMTPGDVADALLAILASDHTGQAWYLQPGRPAEPFGFRNVPGPRAPDGSRVGGVPGTG